MCPVQGEATANAQRFAEREAELVAAAEAATAAAAADGDRLRKALAAAAADKAELEAKVMRAAGALRAADELRDLKCVPNPNPCSLQIEHVRARGRAVGRDVCSHSWPSHADHPLDSGQALQEARLMHGWTACRAPVKAAQGAVN